MGHRCGLHPELLWLWCRLAATAPIQLLAWEPPDVVGAALKRRKEGGRGKKAKKEIREGSKLINKAGGTLLKSRQMEMFALDACIER